MAREINLVPDIKDEMIKTLKLRNLIFFLCIVISSASIIVTFIAGLIVGGQSLAINSKDSTIKTLADKLDSYQDLNDFLTIKDQVGNISTLAENKTVLSRTFDILGVMLPTEADPDTITISEMSVDLSEENPVFSIEAQADSGTAPNIDYNVLDAFKKSMQYLKYDYGNYVDKEGNAIPAYCMIETNSDGSTLRDGEKGIYAFWTINAEGCNPTANTSADENSENTDNATNTTNYTTEDYEGETVVRIWRTPQFKEWFNENAGGNEPQMTRDGQISNVAHFESSCINYKIEFQNEKPYKLDDSDNSCYLVPDAAEAANSPTSTGESQGIIISESSNGRDSSENLVLRFTASIILDKGAFAFSNEHFLALPPSGRINVTDSYSQIQAMFSERAADCAEDDVDCKNVKNGGQ